MRQMRFILALAITTITITACKKESSKESSDNNCYFDSNIALSGNVLTQNQQDEYFVIWKAILMEKSNMTDTYFNNHIVKYKITSSQWNAGISFRIDYIMHIDWIDIKCNDEFIVKMNSSYDAYGYLNIPRDVFFNQNQIESNIASNINSKISYYNLIEKLKFKDCTDLNTAIKNTSGYNVAVSDYATYYVPGKNPREDGNPYVIIKGTINEKENKCLNGQINLNTGECKVWEDACMIE